MQQLSEEFSNEFDVLYNSITSNQAPGIDEYEKSVFLTEALDLILRAYFSPAANKSQEGYDSSSKRQIDFSMVTVTDTMDINKNLEKFDDALFDPRHNSKSVAMPDNVLMMLNERLIVTRDNEQNVRTYLTVVPITFEDYNTLMVKPFKRPNKNQAWRIFNYSGGNKADLVVGPTDEIKEYTIRYVKRPNPIILADLDGLSIRGTSTETTCELDPTLHHEIIQRAVELAKATYQGDLSTQISLGQASQTELGYVQSGRQQ